MGNDCTGKLLINLFLKHTTMTTSKNKTVLDAHIDAKNKETKTTFLHEWDANQFKAIEKAISRHFSGKPMQTEQGNYPAMFLTFAAVADRIGLAYTSSSSYAGYWVCNAAPINPKYPNYRYIGFAISTDGKYYAILWDKDESEIIIHI